MALGSFFQGLSPYARVATAVIPFAIAIAFRLAFGRSRATDIMLTIATCWFAVNVAIAPYSVELQQELHQVLRR